STETSPLSLHDALPIWIGPGGIDEGHHGDAELFGGFHQAKGLSVTFRVGHPEVAELPGLGVVAFLMADEHIALVPDLAEAADHRSEEHTSELQSRENLV